MIVLPIIQQKQNGNCQDCLLLSEKSILDKDNDLFLSRRTLQF
jgi:hypothetical protein